MPPCSWAAAEEAAPSCLSSVGADLVFEKMTVLPRETVSEHVLARLLIHRSLSTKAMAIGGAAYLSASPFGIHQCLPVLVSLLVDLTADE